MDVNEELKFLGKFTKKIGVGDGRGSGGGREGGSGGVSGWWGVGLVGGQVGCEPNVGVRG